MKYTNTLVILTLLEGKLNRWCPLMRTVNKVLKTPIGNCFKIFSLKIFFWIETGNNNPLLVTVGTLCFYGILPTCKV